jgi:UDP-N-acetylglucosamine 2-epimerase
MKRILLVYGTRPEAIKLAPVIREAGRTPALTATVCVTAQHRELLDEVHALFAIRPDFDLGLMRPDQPLAELTARALPAITDVIRQVRPDVVMVQGDTTSAMTGALAAFYQRTPVAHVEAGLRTYDLSAPFPEEMNRQVIGRLTRWHFAPTRRARQNLLGEGVPEAAIEVTGNTSIDALRHLTGEGSDMGEPAPPDLLPRPHERLIMVTAHRRESFGEGFAAICQALLRIVERWPEARIVFPVHPNPNIRAPAEKMLSGHPRIHLVAPMSYGSFVRLMSAAWLLLTDSGGIQEEGPGLGKPVLVMREVTERPEAIEAGTAMLVGTSTERIVGGVALLHDQAQRYAEMATARNPFGDGHAAERIIARLKKDLSSAVTDPSAAPG